ncbi:MAG: hypothetical protein IPG23_17675 [Burkholderiales bacterium]|nr:hypothetical protein [Burkholderiales bacterium]
MQKLSAANKTAIRHYVKTGDYNANDRNWPGQNIVEALTNADKAMREGLIAAVLKRAPKTVQLPTPPIENLVALTRAKVQPMVNGLFPQVERAIVMKALETSVIFLTPENIESVLRTSPWLHTIWDLANMYLLQRGADPLSPDAPSIVGLSQETSCYLSLDYLKEPGNDPFADYLVHEAAHVFHNCRRCTIGLPETRTRHALLNIHYAKRETFAYACEAYSRILTMGNSLKCRRDALALHSQGSLPNKDVVNQKEYLDILAQAVGARNGWKHILHACAPND